MPDQRSHDRISHDQRSQGRASEEVKCLQAKSFFLQIKYLFEIFDMWQNTVESFFKRQTDRQTDRQKYRQTNKHTDREKYRQTYRRTDIQTDRQQDRQTERQTDRQTNRQIFVYVRVLQAQLSAIIWIVFKQCLEVLNLSDALPQGWDNNRWLTESFHQQDNISVCQTAVLSSAQQTYFCSHTQHVKHSSVSTRVWGRGPEHSPGRTWYKGGLFLWENMILIPGEDVVLEQDGFLGLDVILGQDLVLGQDEVLGQDVVLARCCPRGGCCYRRWFCPRGGYHIDSRGKKAHIQALIWALVCSPKPLCALVCAPKLVCALICALNLVWALLYAPKLVCAPTYLYIYFSFSFLLFS